MSLGQGPYRTHARRDGEAATRSMRAHAPLFALFAVCLIATVLDTDAWRATLAGGCVIALAVPIWRLVRSQIARTDAPANTEETLDE